MRQHPRRRILWWAALWLIGLLITEVSHGVLHSHQAAGDGVGGCAVCLLHETPTSAFMTPDSTSDTPLQLSRGTIVCKPTRFYFAASVPREQNPRAPPRVFSL